MVPHRSTRSPRRSHFPVAGMWLYRIPNGRHQRVVIAENRNDFACGFSRRRSRRDNRPSHILETVARLNRPPVRTSRAKAVCDVALRQHIAQFGTINNYTGRVTHSGCGNTVDPITCLLDRRHLSANNPNPIIGKPFVEDTLRQLRGNLPISNLLTRKTHGRRNQHTSPQKFTVRTVLGVITLNIHTPNSQRLPAKYGRVMGNQCHTCTLTGSGNRRCYRSRARTHHHNCLRGGWWRLLRGGWRLLRGRWRLLRGRWWHRHRWRTRQDNHSYCHDERTQLNMKQSHESALSVECG